MPWRYAVQNGGSHEAGPVVGKAGNCDGTFVVVSSHEVVHGGVKTVESAASGAVRVDISAYEMACAAFKAMVEIFHRRQLRQPGIRFSGTEGRETASYRRGQPPRPR